MVSILNIALLDESLCSNDLSLTLAIIAENFALRCDTQTKQERAGNQTKQSLEGKNLCLIVFKQVGLKTFILMEKMRDLLNSQKKKHLILGTKPEWIHTFAQKAQKCFNESWIQTSFLEHVVIEEINMAQGQGFLLFYCSSLRLFLENVKVSALQNFLLKEVSLTFTEEVEEDLNLSNVDLFSNCISRSKICLSSSIELTQEHFKKRIKVIDLMNLSDTSLIDFLNHKQKEPLFNIVKSTSIRNKKMSEYKQIKRKVKVNAKRKKKTFGANSLISISEEVRQFVKKCKRTTPLRTTNYIVDLLKRLKSMNPSKKGSILLKNIQRRVYDAINVLSAVGILSKDKNIITYIREDNYISQGNNNTVCVSNNRDIDKDIKEMQLTIESKQHKLIQGLSELTVYDYFNRVNRLSPNKLETTSKLSLPFNYINNINQHSSSTFLKDYQCGNSLLSSKENKENIKSYDDLITKLSVNIRHTSNDTGKANSLPLSRDCLEYCEKLSEYQSQNIASTTIPIPMKYDSKSAFDLDFRGFNVLDNGLDLSSNDYFYEDNQGSIKRNEYYFEPEDCSPLFDLVMYENNQRI